MFSNTDLQHQDVSLNTEHLHEHPVSKCKCNRERACPPPESTPCSAGGVHNDYITQNHPCFGFHRYAFFYLESCKRSTRLHLSVHPPRACLKASSLCKPAGELTLRSESGQLRAARALGGGLQQRRSGGARSLQRHRVHLPLQHRTRMRQHQVFSQRWVDTAHHTR